MDEKTKQNNLKDLKFYRRTIAMVVIIAVAIGLGVGYYTLNSYEDSLSNDINFKSKFVQLLMDKSITGTTTTGQEMTFYREDNPDFDPETTDDVTDAIKVYYLSEDSNTKVYLEDGFYYPSGSSVSEESVYVIGGFYYTVLENLNTMKSVIKVIIAVIIALAVVFLVYLWYRMWCKSEDKKAELKKQESEFNKNV